MEKPIDAHCHLTDFKRLEDTISNSRKELSLLFTCGYSKETSLAALKLSDGFIYPVVGEAPQRVMDTPEVDIRWLGGVEGIVAIGEIGLDMRWGKTDEQLKNQKAWFEAQLSFAEKRDLPVVIHSRDAETPVLDTLDSFGCKRVLLHCFSGKTYEAKRGVEKGYLITIPPNRSKARRKIIKTVEIDYLMLESDSPYIGKTPWSVKESAEIISDIKGIPPEQVIEITNKNTKRFYGVD